MLIRHAKDCNGRACDLWLRDGKIAAIGQDLPAPEGEEVLDARGLTVLPAPRPPPPPGPPRGLK